MRLGGGAIILIVIVSLLFGVNPLQILGMMEGGGGPWRRRRSQSALPAGSAAARRRRRTRQKRLRRARRRRHRGRLDARCSSRWARATSRRSWSFHGTTNIRLRQRQHGDADLSIVRSDRKVYLDTAFFQELSQRFGAPGDFAQAYVIAHEVGHHVQNQLGTMDKFERPRSARDARQRNAMSVRLELQADCYAGVWGFYAAKRNLLEPGDVEEGMRAASAVGDDNIQKAAVLVPDAFTHGTAAQRTRWFQARE